MKGSSLLEVVVAMVIFAILTLGFARSAAYSNIVRGKTDNNSKAMQLALKLIESYTTIDPLTLDATDNFSDVVTSGTSKFTRAVTVTVNSDVSRTVRVTITDKNSAIKAKADVSITLATQGSS